MISADRIMGFIEGEACFGVGIEKIKDNRPRKTFRKNVCKAPSLGFRVHASFRIFLAQKDRRILDEIKEMLTVGYVYDCKNPGGRSDVVQYAVQSAGELLTLIEFFDKQEFYTTKGQSYLHWKEIVQMVNRKEHLSKEGFLRICALREMMNLVFNKEKRLRSKDFLAEAISPINRFEDCDAMERSYDFGAIVAKLEVKK